MREVEWQESAYGDVAGFIWALRQFTSEVGRTCAFHVNISDEKVEESVAEPYAVIG